MDQMLIVIDPEEMARVRAVLDTVDPRHRTLPPGQGPDFATAASVRPAPESDPQRIIAAFRGRLLSRT